MIHINAGGPNTHMLGQRVVDFRNEPIVEIENTCIQITGQPGKLKGPVKRALGEFCPSVVHPDDETRNILLLNVRVVLERMAIAPNSFSEIAPKSEGVKIACVRNAPILSDLLFQSSDKVVVVTPYQYQRDQNNRGIAKRFRVVVEETEHYENRTRPVLHLLINEWREYCGSLRAVNRSESNMPEQETDALLLNFLKRMAGSKEANQESGWDLVAIILARFSGPNIAKHMHALAQRNVARDFAEKIESLKFSPDVSGIYGVLEAFHRVQPNHALFMKVTYSLPFVYGIDFGSVLKRKMDALAANSKAVDEDALLGEFGNLMYLKPLDVFCTELRRNGHIEDNLFHGLGLGASMARVRDFIVANQCADPLNVWQPRQRNQNSVA